MIIGTGIDIIEIVRIRRACDSYGDRFLNRIFTAAELAYARRRSDPVPSLAVRFAAKEALIKALRVGRHHSLEWTDIEVLTDAEGRPSVKYAASVEAVFFDKKIHISLSHSEHYAAAVVIIED